MREGAPKRRLGDGLHEMEASSIRFVNAPRPLGVDVYEQAIGAYVARVAPRALAIYRVGAFRYPGLSDIDLLVVPSGPRLDNDRWFAVSSQLPASLRLPFRSDPGVVSRDTVDVLRFTTHRERRLLHGTDLAREVVCEETPEQAWSMIFERLCQFDRVAGEIRASGRADLGKLVSKAKSVAYSLLDLEQLGMSAGAQRFREDIDALRGAFFEMKPEEAGVRAWTLFEAGLSALDASLAERLSLADGDRPVDFARAFLHGEAQIPGLSETRLGERRAAVARAQRVARELGFQKGDVFVRTPSAERVAALRRRHRPSAAVRAGLAAAYRARAAWISARGRAWAQS